MDSKLKKSLWFGVSTVILLALIYFADTAEILNALAKAETIYFLPALVFGFSVFFVFGFTWMRFLNKVSSKIGYLKSLRMFMAGQFMNSITPFGQLGGEPFMAYVIRKNTDLEYEEALSTVLSGDIVNTIPTFTFVLGGSIFLFLFGGLTSLIYEVFMTALVIVGIGSILIYLLWFKVGVIENALIRALNAISGFFGRGGSLVKKAEGRLRNIQDTFESIGESPRHLLVTTIIAHGSFVFQVLCLYTIMFSLGFNPDFAPLYFIIAVAGLANFAPTPGGTGAYEATMALMLNTLIQVPLASATVASILFRLATYWSGILVGYTCLLSLQNGGS